MAVESVVSLLIGKLDSLLVGEATLLEGVPTEVRRIKDELRSMRTFLRDADSRAESEAGVKEWVAQVREAAYNIEDVLDEYTLGLSQEPIHHGHKVMVFLRKTIHRIKHVKRHHRIAKKIQELKIDVDGISSRAGKYKFEKMEQGSSSSNAPSEPVSHLRSTARFVEEADLVSIDNHKNELIRLLEGGVSSLKTISVLGMGGLGKTTLAGKVYSSEQVKRHFETFAWVTVSQTFSIVEIFRSMVKQIYGRRIEGVETMGKDEIIQKLRSHLQKKRYVIVLDDLWRVDDWECIKIGLPDGECGSRIMVTTRISEVATACARTSDNVYNLPPLPSEQGWALFCRKAFQSDLGGNCPPDLRLISEKFVQKCGGLPLAIVAVGSLLSNKPKTQVEWQKLYDNLGHQIGSSSSLTIMNQILLLSYNDLPYYLKPCFMYVSIFPEDYLIKKMRLIQLWVAEGFVERREGMSLEEVADEYLHELINRSLIQVASYTEYGKIKACRVHDVVREIILSKAREEKFLTFQNGTELTDKTRRLPLHDVEKIAPKNDLSHLRSFLVFGTKKWPVSSVNAWLSGFRLLKVLDLEGTDINKFPIEIVNLFHLRYLNLKRTGIGTLPKDIGKLKNLETLNLNYTFIKLLPTSIVKLKYLRHLLWKPPFPLGPVKGVKVSPGIGNLIFLQQLGFINLEQGNGVLIQELGELTQLKWLGISHVTSEDGLGLCASIDKMTCLSSLSAVSVNRGNGLLDFKYLSSPPPPLESVYLKGRLEELPRWIPSLSNLLQLKLVGSRLKEDPFTALQHLSNLMKLELSYAYDGEELRCEGARFQRLKSLSLRRLRTLKLMRLEKGAMPNLQKLLIRFCPEFKKVPFGIEHLTHLKDLYFDGVAGELGKSIEREGGEEHWKISHVPLVRFDAFNAERLEYIYEELSME